MERENQVEKINIYGNRNGCYVPFEGGGIVPTLLNGICQNRIYEDSTFTSEQRL